MSRTYIIAEMAWAHDGSVEKALKIMKSAKEAGADAIGIHITDLESYMVPYYGNGEGKLSAGRETADVYKYLASINLSRENWADFGRQARREGIALCVMPNDMNSLEFAEKELAPEMYVLPAASFVEGDFLREVALKKRKTLFRIGGAYIGEIEKAVNTFSAHGNADVVLLHGIQMYPTKLEETNIAFLRTLRGLFGKEVGLADHIDGGSPLAKVIPLLAIAYGASYIEKHITFNRQEKGEDFESALDPGDFREFTDFVRAAETAIGDPAYAGLSPDHLKYRGVVRKKIVASREIRAGETIGREMLAFKRCDTGLEPDGLAAVLGRKAAVKISRDETVTPEKLGD